MAEVMADAVYVLRVMKCSLTYLALELPILRTSLGFGRVVG